VLRGWRGVNPCPGTGSTRDHFSIYFFPRLMSLICFRLLALGYSTVTQYGERVMAFGGVLEVYKGWTSPVAKAGSLTLVTSSPLVSRRAYTYTTTSCLGKEITRTTRTITIKYASLRDAWWCNIDRNLVSIQQSPRSTRPNLVMSSSLGPQPIRLICIVSYLPLIFRHVL